MAGALVSSNVLSTIVAMGMKALRERVVLAKIVNRDYEREITGQSQFSTVNVMIPAPVASRSVSPDVVPPAVTAVTPTNIPITLTEWKEAPFVMDDKGLVQVSRNIVPGQVTEAIKSIANEIDTFLYGLTGGIYGYAGVAGTTPFATDLSEYLDANQQGDAQLMPADPENRFVILNTFAKANALGTNAVQNASWRGDSNAFRKGVMGEILGAQWDYSQNVPLHTTTGAGTVLVNNAAFAAGAVTVAWDGGGTEPGNGDIFTVAGDTQTYVVKAHTTVLITFAPAAKVAWADNAAITFKATHRKNLLIHRDAISFAMAPLVDRVRIEGVPVAQAVSIDEESGLSLRLEVTRQHRQYQWAFDALYGGALTRPEYGVRIAG